MTYKLRHFFGSKQNYKKQTTEINKNMQKAYEWCRNIFTYNSFDFVLM